jgi:hypothetical protein
MPTPPTERPWFFALVDGPGVLCASGRFLRLGTPSDRCRSGEGRYTTLNPQARRASKNAARGLDLSPQHNSLRLC